MRNTGFCMVLWALLAGNSIVGQPVRLHLIPEPKQIELKTGWFEFPEQVVIRSGQLSNIGLDELKALMKSEMGVQAREGSTGAMIRMEKVGGNRILAGEGYILEVQQDHIVIKGASEAGIFYGVQTLSQLIMANREGRKIPCLIIRDQPSIPVRGWQDDISRGPIPTMEFLKKEVRTMAGFKLNAMTLYTEHVFRMKKHPTLAPEDGITEEEIAELSAYAATYHVQVIGNFQSFGHMEKILSKPGYTHLAEAGHILTPALEESYTFMKEVYSEVVPAYSSPYFNINCDETFGLGQGLSKRMADSIGIEGIYGYHINRLNELLKPYSKRILMWGDIAADPKITALLPRDITVISWGYHDAPSFEYAIRPFSDQKLNFWVAPGVSCWGTIFPNHRVARVNISNYIRDGYRLGATGVLNTCWTDDGLNFFENNWYGLVWGAEKSWNPPSGGSGNQDGDAAAEPEHVHFDASFDRIFFGVRGTSVAGLMNALSALHQDRVRDIARNSRMLEPVMPFYPEYVDRSQVALNADILVKLDSLDARVPAVLGEVKRNQIAIDYLKFAIEEIRFSANRNLFRIQLYEYLNKKPDASAPETLKMSLRILYRESERLKNRYAELWRLSCRNWWLDRNLEKFDRLEQGLRDLRGLTVMEVDDELTGAVRGVRLRSMLDNLPVYYTLDGTEPTLNSQKYAGGILLSGDAVIRARVIADGRTFPETIDSLVMHKAIGRLLRLNSTFSTYHPAYEAGGKLGLLDGRTGDVRDIRSGRWQGYSGQDINLEIDLGKTDTVRFLSMGFYQHTTSWVILPKRLELYSSDDGVHYRLERSLDHPVPADAPDPVVWRFDVPLNGLVTRYLKVVGVYYGPLPEFHASKGQPSMMFADEVVVR